MLTSADSATTNIDEHNLRLEDCRGQAFKWSRDGTVVIAHGV